MLRNSVKFLLPNCCELIDPEDFKQTHLDVLKLPYPCVAFEASWHKEGEHLRTGEFAETLSTKRIALCWESDPMFEAIPGINYWLQHYPDGGVFALPIYYGDEQKQWHIASGGLFVPHENEVRKITMDPRLPASLIAKEVKLNNGEAKKRSKEFLAEPFVVLPEFYEQIAYALGSKEKATANILLNAHDDTGVQCSQL